MCLPTSATNSWLGRPTTQLKTPGVETIFVTGEWMFRTTTGIGTVADGRLRISGSLGRIVREKWRENWTQNEAGRRLLFVFSVGSTVAFLHRVVTSLRAILSGTHDSLSMLVVGAFVFAILVVAYRATRIKTVRLRAIETVRRVDNDELRIEFEDKARGTDNIKTPTEADADEALEMLRLRGVSVENSTDTEEVVSAGFRRRLQAKRE
jgi:hypothetical protein